MSLAWAGPGQILKAQGFFFKRHMFEKPIKMLIYFSFLQDMNLSIESRG